MKKAALLLLTLSTLPVYAQGLMGTLNKYQETLETKPTAEAGKTPTPEVKPSKVTASSASAKCEENDQTSLPLSYASSLITEPEGKFNFIHDARGGTLSVTAPEMIGNCSSMLQWNLKQPEIQGRKAYAVEVKIKEGENCTPEGCTYKVAKVKDGNFDKFEDVVLKPNLKGFEECLQKSGVIVDNKVVPGAIYNSPVKEKFTGVDQSAQLLFVSHGPASALVKAKYGQYEPIDRCDYYEKAHPEVTQLLTYADQERQRLDAEAAKLMDCPINEYHKVADFIEKYEAYSSQLSEVRDRLILETAKKSAAAIGEGKYTDEDLKVLSDFEKYVVQPKIELATLLYEQMYELEGEQRAAVEGELKRVLAQIAELKKPPYFTGAHTQKLVKDGRFEEAKALNTVLLTIDSYSTVGQNIKGVVATPTSAHRAVLTGSATFRAQLEKEKEYYQIRTGQVRDVSGDKLAEMQNLRNQAQRVVEASYFNIQEAYADLQPGGHCSKYWVNTNRCVQEAMEDIQYEQNKIQRLNALVSEDLKKLQAEAEMYKKLEAEGDRYLAGQSGEPVPEVKENLLSTSSRVERRKQGATPGTQTEEQLWQLQLQSQQQMMMNGQGQGQNQGQNFFQQQNPYGYNLGQYAQYSNGMNGMNGQQQMFGQQQMYGQQNYLGQQAYNYGSNNGFGFQGNFNFGLGMGSNGYQQPMFGQPMYGQQQMFGQQQYGYNNNMMGGYQLPPQYSFYR